MVELLYSSNKYVKGIKQPLSFNKETKTFSVEISEINQCCPETFVWPIPKFLKITDVDTDKELLFKFTKADMDGSQEDTYGWNFVSTNCKLLIIND